MPLYLISFSEEGFGYELKDEEGQDPKNLHEARNLAVSRWPDRSMEVWSPTCIDYFTRQIRDTA